MKEMNLNQLEKINGGGGFINTGNKFLDTILGAFIPTPISALGELGNAIGESQS